MNKPVMMISGQNFSGPLGEPFQDFHSIVGEYDRPITKSAYADDTVMPGGVLGAAIKKQLGEDIIEPEEFGFDDYGSGFGVNTSKSAGRPKIPTTYDGETSEYLAQAQAWLNSLGGENLLVNGIMDGMTSDAILRFQMSDSSGLTPTGLLDQDTYYAIEARANPQVTTQAAAVQTPAEQSAVSRAAVNAVQQAGGYSAAEVDAAIAQAQASTVKTALIIGGVVLAALYYYSQQQAKTNQVR